MVLNARNLTLTLGGTRREIFQDASFSLGPGETTLLTGPAGAGKTALGITLSGHLPHWAGVFSLRGGIDILGHPLEQGHGNPDVGILLENPWSQLSGLKNTVGEELAFPLECRGMSPEEIPAAIARFAGMFGIVRLLPRRARTLSGGELQRVLAACALIAGPRVLFLDRPLTEIDLEFRPAFLEIIRDHAEHTEGAIVLAEDPWLIPGTRFNRTFRLEHGVFTEARTDTPGHSELPNRRKAPSGALLRVENLRFSYTPETPVIEDLSFSAGEGDIAFVTGPNGAGKSTLARILSGVIRPHSGEISLAGAPYRRMRERDIMARVGYALQNAGLHLSRNTVGEELDLAAKWGHPPGALTEILGFGDERDAHPLELSEGGKKRLAIALSGGGNRQAVILDEPTQYQDEAGFRRTAEAIRHIAGRGAAVLLISHDPRLSRQFPDAREIMMNAPSGTA